ncbi:hypothetical protein H9P43_000507 [Blastocladiella emersonii ATCC 22665]|nr:hypothetical protein H9P43_000507 [Blastocladiella emersonii ATCC 22665]
MTQTQDASIQRDINRVFATYATPSGRAGPSRIGNVSARPAGANSKALTALPSHELEKRLKTQLDLLRSIETGALAPPDGGERVRSTIAIIRGVLASRTSVDSLADSLAQTTIEGENTEAAVAAAEADAGPMETDAADAARRPSAAPRMAGLKWAQDSKIHALSIEESMKAAEKQREEEHARNLQATMERLKRGTLQYQTLQWNKLQGGKSKSKSKTSPAFATSAYREPGGVEVVHPDEWRHDDDKVTGSPSRGGRHFSDDDEDDSEEDDDEDFDDSDDDLNDGLDLGVDDE